MEAKKFEEMVRKGLLFEKTEILSAQIKDYFLRHKNHKVDVYIDRTGEDWHATIFSMGGIGLGPLPIKITLSMEDSES